MIPSNCPILLREIVYNEVGTDYAIPAHVHALFQWYLVVYGRVDTIVNGVTYTLGPEESVLIPPGVARAPACRHKAPGYLFALFENHGLSLDGLVGKVLVTPPELRPDLAALVRELHQPGTNTHELVEALLVRLLIGLVRGTEGEALTERGSTLNLLSNQEVVERVDAFMQHNLQRNLTRADLAAAVHLSPTHLARVFRQVTGGTLTDRLMVLRVTRAKQLLLESTLPMSEISLQIGYSSFSHFARVFRRMIGVTPGDYRRSQGNVWRKMDI